jgi:O-antigen/teichoic acid export membrane protein
VLFGHQYLSIGCLTLGFILVLRGELRRRGAIPGFSLALSPERLKGYTREFRRYSSPLLVTALASTLILSGERWLLQFFEGSVQQGYFSLSLKVGTACFLFVSALTPLLMREMAVAHGQNNPRGMALLLDRYAPMLYSLAAWLACFVLAEAPAVVRIFGGQEFHGALLPVQIMALYPIHQGYGQLASAVFYAGGETRLLRNLTLVSLTLGLGMTWILLAPAALGGLNLGAEGLAVKMVLAQFLTVNLLFWFGRKTAPFNFGRNLAHQLVCPPVLAALAFGSRMGTEALGLGAPGDIPRFFVSGIIYCLMTGALALAVPALLGLRRDDFGKLRAKIGRPE